MTALDVSRVIVWTSLSVFAVTILFYKLRADVEYYRLTRHENMLTKAFGWVEQWRYRLLSGFFLVAAVLLSRYL